MSGIDELRQRRQGGTPPRRMPAPLRPRPVVPPTAPEPVAGQTPTGRPGDSDPLVALGVRIPRSLDDRLALLGVQLRLRGVRRTKADLVAHALRQLPFDVTDEFVESVRG